LAPAQSRPLTVSSASLGELQSPGGHFSNGMKVVVGLSPRVLLCHFCTEREVRTHGVARRLVAGQVRFTERFKIENDESLPLFIRNPKVPVDVDDVLKPEFTSESIGSPEGLGGEPSEVVHMRRHPLGNQGTENRIVKDLLVEDLLQPMYGFIPAGVLVDRLQLLPSDHPALDADYSCVVAGPSGESPTKVAVPVVWGARASSPPRLLRCHHRSGGTTGGCLARKSAP
jgi:hypothetical protein